MKIKRSLVTLSCLKSIKDVFMVFLFNYYFKHQVFQPTFLVSFQCPVSGASFALRPEGPIRIRASFKGSSATRTWTRSRGAQISTGPGRPTTSGNAPRSQPDASSSFQVRISCFLCLFPNSALLCATDGAASIFPTTLCRCVIREMRLHASLS